METITAGEMSEYLGISKFTLVHWVNRGVLKPHIHAHGRGGRRRFSFKNLFMGMVVVELHSVGFELWIILDIISSLENYTVDNLNKKVLWHTKAETNIIDEGELIEQLPTFSGAMVINLSHFLNMANLSWDGNR